MTLKQKEEFDKNGYQMTRAGLAKALNEAKGKKGFAALAIILKAALKEKLDRKYEETVVLENE